MSTTNGKRPNSGPGSGRLIKVECPGCGATPAYREAEERFWSGEPTTLNDAEARRRELARALEDDE